MPLDRHHVTVASRIMLPVYVVFFAALGVNYTFAPIGRLVESPGLAYAHSLAPLRAWGCVFLLACLTMLAALLTKRREWFRFALALCGLTMGIFSVVMGIAIFAGEASATGWTWPLFVVAACIASYRSLTVGEVDTGG